MLEQYPTGRYLIIGPSCQAANKLHILHRKWYSNQLTCIRTRLRTESKSWCKFCTNGSSGNALDMIRARIPIHLFKLLHRYAPCGMAWS
jgi:hypothetical protein